MNLQKNSSLALYSVIEIAAAAGRHVPAAEIAAKYAVSAHHLAKVLSELARAGIVESVRGVGGGYRFVGNAKRLTLLDVISLFEDIGSAPSRAPGELTPVESALEAISAEIDEVARSTFGSITLATMLRLVDRAARVAAAPAESRSLQSVQRPRAGARRPAAALQLRPGEMTDAT
ncbi:MAG: Rrf2 family transcriptional regulator [Limnobacter sp.]|nr:Rrf2 family transcriptional regulator [Limnobacter sp.]